MARIRTVKPELFRHEELFDAELSSGLPLRLSYIGLFTVADCEGRFRWKPRTLKLDILPHDMLDFSLVLNALEKHGFVIRYEVDGEPFGEIPHFKQHQRFQTKELESGSSLPINPSSINKSDVCIIDFMEEEDKEPSKQPENLRDDTGTIPENFQNEPSTQPGHAGKGKGKGREEEGNGEEQEREMREKKPRASTSPTKKPVLPKVFIADDWKPAERCYEILDSHGIDRTFARMQINEFILYWQERQEKRAGWDATFVNRVKDEWDRRSKAHGLPSTARNGPGKTLSRDEKNAIAMAEWAGMGISECSTIIEGESNEVH